MSEFFTHNAMLWVAQISLACVFIYAAFSKAFPRRASATPGAETLLFACDGMPCLLASFIAVLEFAGAVCLLIPYDIWPAYLLPRVAAGALAPLIAITGFHHMRHKLPTAPIVAVFFLALFVLVGRWP